MFWCFGSALLVCGAAWHTALSQRVFIATLLLDAAGYLLLRFGHHTVDCM